MAVGETGPEKSHGIFPRVCSLHYTITDVYKYLCPGVVDELATLLAPGDARAFHRGRTPPRPSENDRVVTSVPLITDNSRKARGCERVEPDDDDGGWGRGRGAERVRKGAGTERERERERERQRDRERETEAEREGGRVIAGMRTRREAESERERERARERERERETENERGREREARRLVSMGPIEEPFSYSKQQRPAGTRSLRSVVSASRLPGNHLLSLEAIARHNGQVIHPLRLLARETTTAPGRHSSSSTRLRRVSAFREAATRKRDRDEGTRAHVRRLAVSVGPFASSPFISRVARDCYRLYPCKPSLDRLDGQPPSSSSSPPPASPPARPMSRRSHPLSLTNESRPPRRHRRAES